MKMFVSENLKLVSALTAAGFAEKSVDVVNKNGRDSVVCEVEAEANGLTAEYMAALYESKAPCPVDEIIERRGITPTEAALIIFDGGRAAGQNRVALLKAGQDRAQLIVKDVGNGRTLIYRAGTPKDELRKLINS